ncbi:MAG: putative anti-sigma regulatory factor, serine/threonine protein kinase [Pseudonocardiales bacterium]|nr:putative anti-sigma regulatory factor, serine/threonine protein kinase [Pseudonocardiales bacterium]
MRSLWVHRSPASAATVRHRISVDLRQAGFSPDLADDAALLASELISNAIRHATSLPSGELEVAWTIDPQGVRLQVTDGGSHDQPQLRQASLDDTSGRGLAIVAALSDGWGVQEHSLGRTVWAYLARPVGAAH